jgi:hypothetical protein
LRRLPGRRYFLFMSNDPLGADLEEHRLRRVAPAAADARPAWMGFLAGAVVLGLAILIAVGIWQFADNFASPLTPAELTEVESLLAQLGFPPGAVDGAIDADSRNAIRDFQVTADLEVNGRPSIALLDELRAAQAELSGN